MSLSPTTQDQLSTLERELHATMVHLSNELRYAYGITLTSVTKETQYVFRIGSQVTELLELIKSD